jgi:hypothetical protein
LNGGIAQLDVGFSVIGPAWWVADRRIDILQADWEVDVVEVEVFESPVCKLLSADWLNVLLLVEGVPELADNEKLFALDDTVCNCAGDTLAGFNLVSVV